MANPSRLKRRTGKTRSAANLDNPTTSNVPAGSQNHPTRSTSQERPQTPSHRASGPSIGKAQTERNIIEEASRRSNSKTLANEVSRRSASPIKSRVSAQWIHDVGHDDRMRNQVLNTFTDEFWSEVLITPHHSRQRDGGSGSDELGYQLTAAEDQIWNSVLLVRPTLEIHELFSGSNQSPNQHSREAALKYTLGLLFVNLLTTPSACGSNFIEKVLYTLIIDEVFIPGSRGEGLFLDVLIGYEIQKYWLLSLGELKETVQCLFSNFAYTRDTLLSSYLHLLRRDHDEEHEPNVMSMASFEARYHTLSSLRDNPEEIETKYPYLEFINLIVALVLHEFPARRRKSEPSGKLQDPKINDRYKALGARNLPAGTSKNTPPPATEERRSLSDSNSFSIAGLLPNPSVEPGVGQEVPDLYTGVRAGTPENRHHENVASEAVCNAELFKQLMEDESPSWAPKAQDTRSPDSSTDLHNANPKIQTSETQREGQLPPAIVTESTSQMRSSPNKAPSRFQYNQKQRDAVQIPFDTQGSDDELHHLVADSNPNVDELMDRQSEPHSSILSSAQTGNRPSHTGAIDLSKDVDMGSIPEQTAPQQQSSSATKSPESPVDRHNRNFKGKNAQNETDPEETTPTPLTNQHQHSTAQRLVSKQPQKQKLGQSRTKFVSDEDSSDDSDVHSANRKKEQDASKVANKHKPDKHVQERHRSRTKATPSHKSTRRRRDPSPETLTSPSARPRKARKRSPEKIAKRPLSSSPEPSGSRNQPGKASTSRIQDRKSKRRQFWNDDQEELLIKEVVKYHERYDCMAYILTRHGTEGSHSQTLANRTNVMLKDKAIQISTKWAREEKRLDPRTMQAFQRFPPKSGKLLAINSETESESESESNSNSESDEDGIKLDQLRSEVRVESHRRRLASPKRPVDADRPANTVASEDKHGPGGPSDGMEGPYIPASTPKSAERQVPQAEGGILHSNDNRGSSVGVSLSGNDKEPSPARAKTPGI